MPDINDWQEVPLSAAHINDWQEIPMQQNFSQRVNSDWNKRGDEAINTTLANPLDAAAIEAKTGLGAGYDYAKEGAKSAWDSLPNAVTGPIGSGAEWLKNDFLNTPEGSFLRYVAPVIGKVAEDQAPTATHIAQVVGDVLPAKLAAEGVANEGVAKFLPKIATTVKNTNPIDFIKNQASGHPNAILPKPLPLDLSVAHSEISTAYGNALKGATPFYDYMNKTAEGKFINAAKMISPVKKMIADIEADPFHEGRTSLPRLRTFVEQVEANPNMPLSDAVSMKQEINSNFNPKRFDQGSKTPYFEFGNILDGKLRQAAKQYPDFGVAKKLADKNWVNNVVDPFTGNTELQKFWKPEDYYNQKSVDNGLREKLPDPTRARAESMLGKITTPVELDAITRPMSQDTAAAFRKAKFEDITNGAGSNRLQSAGKTVASAFNLAPLDTAKNALKTITGPDFTRAEIALMKATKLPSPVLNQEYAKQLDILKNLSNSSPKLLTWQKPLGYQEIPPSSASSEMMGGNQTSPKIASPQQVKINEVGRQRATDLGMYPKNGVGENIAPAQAVASQGQSPLLRQYGNAPLLGNENIPPPIYPAGNPNAFSNAAHIQSEKAAQAQSLADMAKAGPLLDASRQITPEQVQDIFKNRMDVGNITGNAPQNSAIAEALLSAFKNGNGQ